MNEVEDIEPGIQRMVLNTEELYHDSKKHRQFEDRLREFLKVDTSSEIVEYDDGLLSYLTESVIPTKHDSLYNVPNDLFKANFGQTYSGIVAYLKNADLKHFKSQNGVRQLFGPSKDLWNVDEAKKFVLALEQIWKRWPNLA